MVLFSECAAVEKNVVEASGSFGVDVSEVPLGTVESAEVDATSGVEVTLISGKLVDVATGSDGEVLEATSYDVLGGSGSADVAGVFVGALLVVPGVSVDGTNVVDILIGTAVDEASCVVSSVVNTSVDGVNGMRVVVSAGSTVEYTVVGLEVVGAIVVLSKVTLFGS